MKATLLGALLAAPFALAAQSGPLAYPTTRKVDTLTDYHGTRVADPYRWLEDDRSEETKAWVAAQNKVTFGYLENIPYRAQWMKRLEELNNYPKYGAPFRNNDYYYFYKNDGLQNQSVLYRQKGLSGRPEPVLDPNGFSAEGTTSLATFSLSENGRYAVVGKSAGGSDWRTYFVMDMQTLKYLPDSLAWIKSSGAAWRGDGFFYSRYPKPASGSDLSAKNENHQVYFHKVGTAQEQDVLVYEDKANVQRFHNVGTSEDERYSLLYIRDRGAKGKLGNALWFRDERAAGSTYKPLIGEVTDLSYSFVTEAPDGRFLVLTNDGAQNNRVVSIDPNNPDRSDWKTIIAEGTENITGISTAGGKLFVSYLKDVTSRVYVHGLDGKREREVKLPALGTASVFGGKKGDKELFFTFTSFTFAPTIYKYDIATGKTDVFRKPEVKFNSDDYVTEQVFFPSKDGTKVPMFIVYKKGLKRDGSNPTLMYGYGGFNVPSNPGFSPTRIGWLEQGGVYVLVNLRGGSEYGEKWHEAGMRHKKQNVFDDFIAAGEHLVKTKYTSPERLAIQGGSNGGTLVGAVMNQRPDLFKVAIPQVGVMDMLRFQKFTIGWNWIAEYGSSENPADFKTLYNYSPIHNLKRGVNYPATLITTADHDDRVVPAHSFKYAATLQELYKGNNPVLIRVDVNSGHGASNLKKSLETTADIYSFIFHNMKLTPKFEGVAGGKESKKTF
ncbi:prolyl oligopeptidase family serine peptidase [Flaviaesturariibacter amylovorans]|uniref:prolyl oligopeptidase n=1 Tax=Flaviaesturariibacter amylovorans TaxID=1084520 RepID=A0ABP8HEU0_9BACT